TVFARTVDSDNSSMQVFTLEDVGLTNDDVFKGVLVSRDYGISIPRYWNRIENAEVNINFSHSISLNTSSTMTVDWNGVRLGSIQLTSENVDHGQLKIPIPVDNINPGYNTLHVEFYMGISDDFCDDYDNPAVWATIHKTTTFSFNADLSKVEPDLGNLPSPFFDDSPIAGNHVTFVVSEKPGQGEINALAVMNARLGQLSGGWRPVLIDLISFDKAKTEKVKGNFILIGTLDKINGFDKSIQIQSSSDENGILSEFLSPFDNTSLVLAVSGKTQESVEKAGRAFSNGSLYSRLSGSEAIIKSNAVTSSGSRINQISMTLEQLGYPNNVAYGTREQKISYNIPLTSLWQAKTEATLDLHYFHAVINSEEKPTLTVSVNDLPVGSITLKPDDANGTHQSFQLPLDFFKVGNNNLTIQSNMQVFSNQDDVSLHCADYRLAQAWLTINNDSTIKFPTLSDYSTAEISNFPYAFMGKSDLSELAFVIPSNPSVSDMETLSTLAVSMGKSSQGEPVMLHVLTSDQAETNQPYSYKIYIGQPLTNPAIINLGDQLPLPFNSSTGEAKPLPILDTIESGKISTGYIQAFISSSQTPNLVVSGNDGTGLMLAADQLSINSDISRLKGDLTITTGANRVMSIWGKSTTNESSKDGSVVTQHDLTIDMWLQYNAAIYTAIGFLVITVLVIVIRLIMIIASKKTNG
ncbi:MAG: cellulose biosynthesis cyclic di-GMP-binding regulatory protein BcsB, partial [Anaerolineae bacterium]|nr:cellulose biosynthesis cyclic di-GMP-binding regulatory protein BcsB [Anaerolineae bacterium]